MSEITELNRERFTIIDTYALMRDSGANHAKAIETLKKKGWSQEVKVLEFIHDDLEPKTYEKYFRNTEVSVQNPSVSNSSIGQIG